MGQALRDPGAQVLIGILSFSVSFFAIGLAIAALAKPYGDPFMWTAFGIGSALFIGGILYAAWFVGDIHGERLMLGRLGALLVNGDSLEHRRVDSDEGLGSWQKEVDEWVEQVCNTLHSPAEIGMFRVPTDVLSQSVSYEQRFNKPHNDGLQLLHARLVNLSAILQRYAPR